MEFFIVPGCTPRADEETAALPRATSLPASRSSTSSGDGGEASVTVSAASSSEVSSTPLGRTASKVDPDMPRLLQSMRNSGLTSAVGLSVQFRTLRDMKDGDTVIDEESLKFRKQIGSGGFGTVHLCDYISGGKSVPVAVKRLKAAHLEDPKEVENFTTECSLLKRLRHRSIVEFIGVGAALPKSKGAVAWGGTNASTKYFMVTEYCSGGSIRDVFIPEVGTRPNGALAYVEASFLRPKGYRFATALEWLISVARGLDYLHSASPLVIHRDIKMENILLTKDVTGESIAKLADFGLSAVTDVRAVAIRRTISGQQRDMQDRNATKARVRSFGKVAYYADDDEALSLTRQTGTIFYMAPEVIVGNRYNEQADIFSFGILMHELMTGIPMICRTQYCSASTLRLHAVRVAQGVRPPVPEELPKEVAALTESLWAHRPASRPKAHEVVERLKELRPVVQRWDKQLWKKSVFACCSA